MEVEEIKEAICKDPEVRKVIQKLNMAGGSDNRYSLVNGCLLIKGMMAVPRASAWVPKLLTEFHATPVGGHSGALRTYKKLASSFFWQGMKRDVCKFVAECVMCKNKVRGCLTRGIATTLSYPESSLGRFDNGFYYWAAKVEGS